jgi:hypothetical protein
MVIEDPDNPFRTLLLAVKNNLGPKAGGLGYTIGARFVGPGIVTSRIDWDNDPVTITANEALEAWADKKKAKATNEAEDFLRMNMAAGQSYEACDIKEKASHAGIAERTLRRARAKLGIKKSKNGFGGKMWWQRDD